MECKFQNWGTLADVADQSFKIWNSTGNALNEYAPGGARRTTTKICNAHWNRVTPLEFKWIDCVEKMYWLNPSGTNEEHIIDEVHDLHFGKIAKKFKVMHWSMLSKEQPKWKIFCDQIIEVSSQQFRINEMSTYSLIAPPLVRQPPRQ